MITLRGESKYFTHQILFRGFREYNFRFETKQSPLCFWLSAVLSRHWPTESNWPLMCAWLNYRKCHTKLYVLRCSKKYVTVTCFPLFRSLQGIIRKGGLSYHYYGRSDGLTINDVPVCISSSFDSDYDTLHVGCEKASMLDWNSLMQSDCSSTLAFYIYIYKIFHLYLTYAALKLLGLHFALFAAVL